VNAAPRSLSPEARARKEAAIERAGHVYAAAVLEAAEIAACEEPAQAA
jgi:hypothetical protein